MSSLLSTLGDYKEQKRIENQRRIDLQKQKKGIFDKVIRDFSEFHDLIDMLGVYSEKIFSVYPSTSIVLNTFFYENDKLEYVFKRSNNSFCDFRFFYPVKPPFSKNLSSDCFSLQIGDLGKPSYYYDEKSLVKAIYDFLDDKFSSLKLDLTVTSIPSVSFNLHVDDSRKYSDTDDFYSNSMIATSTFSHLEPETDTSSFSP